MEKNLGSMPEGSIVKLKEDGKLVEFYVAKHNYESSLNGMGRTLVVRKDCYTPTKQWNDSAVTVYASSAIDAWLNSNYKNLLDTDILGVIRSTKFKYTLGYGNTTVGTLQRAIFLLSGTELGGSANWCNVEGTALETARLLQIAYYNGSTVNQWTRSPSKDSTVESVYFTNHGYIYYNTCHFAYGARPAFTLPSTLSVSDDGTVSVNTAPSTPSSISVPGNVFVPISGASISVSWSSSYDVNGNLSGYKLERQVDSGSWSQVYSGSSTGYTDRVSYGSRTVQYRVKAFDSLGLESGYKLSQTVSLVNVGNPTIQAPTQAMTGQSIPISWSPVTQATSYKLERKANTDSRWSQIYSGAELSYSDTVGKWTSVQYRVRAVVSGSDGDWATSASIPIISESVLSISGSNSDLGTLVSDVPYSISTDTGKPITGTITINGLLVFSGTVDSGTPQAISILDIPTGAEKGTITIKATVQAGSGPVTATRIWTYTKTPIRYTGGRCDIIQCEGKEGAKQYPMTVAEAVRLPGGLTLDQLYQMLVKKGVIP